LRDKTQQRRRKKRQKVRRGKVAKWPSGKKGGRGEEMDAGLPSENEERLAKRNGENSAGNCI